MTHESPNTEQDEKDKLTQEELNYAGSAENLAFLHNQVKYLNERVVILRANLERTSFKVSVLEAELLIHTNKDSEGEPDEEV